MTNNYESALRIACDLLAGCVIYGIDQDRLFEVCITLPKYGGVVTGNIFMDFILNNLDRFSDDDSIRHKAIERLGF